MLIGYARVSTADQKFDLQDDALTKAGCERIFTDTAGGAGAERTGLEQFLGFAPKGDTLLTNAVIAWNTVYMAAAIDRLRIDGHPVQEADLAHLSPCRYEHINPYGKYAFEVSEDLRGAALRPIRSGRSGA
jgi:hypothetical protein